MNKCACTCDLNSSECVPGGGRKSTCAAVSKACSNFSEQRRSWNRVSAAVSGSFEWRITLNSLLDDAPIGKRDYWKYERWKQKEKWMLPLAHNPSHQASGRWMVNSNSKQFRSVYVPCYFSFCICSFFSVHGAECRFTQRIGRFFYHFLGDKSDPCDSEPVY